MNRIHCSKIGLGLVRFVDTGQRTVSFINVEALKTLPFAESVEPLVICSSDQFGALILFQF